MKVRVAVVTGGGGGLGSATAANLVGRGCRVVVADLREDAAAATARQLGDAAWAIQLDVTSEAACKEMAAKVMAKEGRIDILVNSHGINGTAGGSWEIPEGDWEKVIAVNLHGVFYMCRAVLPYMIKAGYGRIVNLASITGKEGTPFRAAYATSKAGVIGFTKSVAREVATKGILVNAIAPGTIETPLTKGMGQEMLDFLVSRTPMGRLGRPEEVGAMIGWLCSDECSLSTGAVFDISGGRATY